LCTLIYRITRLSKGDKQFWKRDIDRERAIDEEISVTEGTSAEVERGKESSFDEKKSD
jgi:hypothetical protein